LNIYPDPSETETGLRFSRQRRAEAAKKQAYAKAGKKYFG
jgi:hypothetical protein